MTKNDSTKTSKILFVFTVVLLLAATLMVGCQTDLKPTSADNSNYKTVEQSLAAQSKLNKFDNYAQLSSYLSQNAQSSNSYYGDYRGGMLSKEAVAAPMMQTASLGSADAVSSAPAPTSTSDYSQTNVQVQGVDEADFVKADGKYIYAVSGNTLSIIDAFPAKDAKVVSKIEFKNTPTNIYVNGNYLTVFGNDYNIKESYKTLIMPSNTYTYFKVFDITDKKDPKIVRDLDFEGSYTDSRMIGDYVYMIVDNYQYNIYDDYPIPRILENGVLLGTDVAGSKQVNHPDVYYLDIPYNSYKFTNVVAINVVDNSEKFSNEVYLLGGDQELYVSEKNIYITYTKYISEYQLQQEILVDAMTPRLSDKEKALIEKIKSTDSDVMSKPEKDQKILQIVQRAVEQISSEDQTKLDTEVTALLKQKLESMSNELQKTIIHKIAIDKTKIEYKSSGEVPGRVLNQFSMDENNGYFRIATTKDQQWSSVESASTKQYNNLYVLDENLKVVGKVEKLAEDEKIYSVRFMQNRAYMVTFKQVDPLFVIDLSDPTNPTVLGKLKIPGFSQYLHPYDDTHLIGIGKDTTETESGGVRTAGIKISLFDVSDVANPVESAHYVLGDAGSDSAALYDHKAFLFSKEKNLLVIPVDIRQNTADNQWWGKLTFSGAAVFTITPTSIELKGKIDHSDGKVVQENYWYGYNYWETTVKRSLYMDNTLYTLSQKYLAMNDLSDLKEINKIQLTPDSKDVVITPMPDQTIVKIA